jgi:glucose-1-phosphate adenylyltransferase
MIEAHIEKGADVTIAYNESEIPEAYLTMDPDQGFYYTYTVEDGRIVKLKVNSKKEGIQNVSLNMFVIERELLIDLINTANVRGLRYFERDVLLNKLDELNVQGYKYDGYVGRISSLKSYFEENMKLLEDENLDALFGNNAIHTKIRDDNPTRYIKGAEVENVMAADGCVIEGKVKNSILFRGVKVGKGAEVENCILMQDTVVEAGAELEYVVTDKDVVITEGKELKGSDTYPVYVAKKQTV